MPVKKAHEIKEPTDKACMGHKGSKGRSGTYCKKAPGWGTWHPGVGRCKLHGGAAPDYSAEVHRLRAIQAVKKYALPVPIDPHTALIKELERTHGLVLFLEYKVNNLEDEGPQVNMVGPVGGGQGAIPEYKPSVWYQMFCAERKHLEDVAKSCIQAGIEERRVQLAESQGQMIAQVLQAVLGELKIPDSQADKVPGLVGKHLRLIQGGAAEAGAA